MPALLTAYIITAMAWSLLSLWLSARQMACVRSHRNLVPDDFAATVSLEEHQKAADYTVACEQVAGVRTIWDLLVSLAWVLGGINLLYGGLTGLLPPSPARGVAFLVASFAIGALLSLPLDLYRTFVVEQRFGFNRTTPVMFAIDRAKSWAIGLAFAVPLLFACLWAMHAFSGLWWLWTWVGVVVLMLAAPTVYVRLIAPRFNKFTPLQQGELRSRIETLLHRCGFRPSGLFSMDASRRSAHGNAFFIGFGKTKRVVLFDTLIEASTPDEIEAVVAHELGHDKHGHVLFGLLRSAAMTFAMLAAFGWLSKQPWLLPGFGIVYQDDALALLACLLVVGMVGPLLAPISNWMSRRNEFQADDFARRQVAAAPMINALLRLSRDNASTLTPDSVYALVHYSHPPVPLRVRHLHAAEEREMPGSAAAAATI